VGSMVAEGDSDSIDWRFVVEGAVKAETIAHEVDASTVCLLKAA
jgi:Mycobacterium membrane protein